MVYNIVALWQGLPVGQQLAVIVLLVLILYLIGLVQIAQQRRF